MGSKKRGNCSLCGKVVHCPFCGSILQWHCVECNHGEDKCGHDWHYYSGSGWKRDT